MRSSSEPAIYTRKCKSSQLIVGVYVDDLVITGPESGDICMFKEITTKFKMSDLGLLWYYLGIEVKQNSMVLHSVRKLMHLRPWRGLGCNSH
jgi:hypothetical protein